MKQKINLGIFLCLTLVLIGCASVGRLSGGPKDNKAPVFQPEKSSIKNQSIQFKGTKIVLAFDDYIALKSPFDNIIMTPAPKKRPKYIVSGENLEIKFQDSLQDNTTYTISFNNAITDITEKNDTLFQFVFSTGDFLDSLQLKGNVRDALGGEIPKDITVMLYPELTDSIPLLKRPKYFIKTDKEGTFRLNNLKDGKYKIVAIEDGNQNLMYDQSKESIGFLLDPVELKDNSLPPLEIVMFDEQKIQKVKKTTFENPGKIQVIFETTNSSADVTFVNKEQEKLVLQKWISEEKDSIEIWLKPKHDLKETKFLIETPLIKKEVTIAVGESNYLKKLTLRTKPGKEKDWYKGITFFTNVPLLSVDEKKIKIWEDSIVIQPKVIWGKGEDQFIVDHSWKPRKDYRIELETGAVKDLYNRVSDSLEIKFLTKPEESYAIFSLDIKIPNQTKQYVVQVLTKEGKIVLEKVLKKSQVLKEKYMNPGQYKIRAIVDENKNGKWDTGVYLKGIQPEKIIIYEKEVDVKVNWDQEIVWDLE